MENMAVPLDARKLISYLQVLSLWVLIVALPFRMGPLQYWIMIAAVVLFVLEYVANQRWRTWHWERNKWLYVAMIAYYLLIPIWQLWSDCYDPRHFAYTLENGLPLLVGGAVGIIGFGERVKLRPVCYVFMAGCVLISLYIMAGTGDGLAFFTHPRQYQSDTFKLARQELVNSHMMYNLYLNVSLVFALYLLQQKDVKRWVRVLVAVACVWTFYLLCITEGRIGLFTALLIGASFLLAFTYRRGKVLFGVVTAAYMAACVVLVSQHQRFGSDNVEHDPRWLIWEATIDIIKEKPLLGHGVCEAKEELTEKAVTGEGALQSFYAPRLNERNIHRLPHPHNAFLQAWCCFGIIGLVIQLSIFTIPLVMRPKKNRLYILMIVGCFVIQSITDIFFTPQPLLYSLSIMFFTLEQSRLPIKTEKNEN